MKAIEFTTYEQKIIDFIKRNKNKSNLFIASVPSVSASGMSRTIKLAVIYQGELTNITWLVAKCIDEKLDKNGNLRIGGCGMDMIFATIEWFISSLGFSDTYKLACVQHYKYF